MKLTACVWCSAIIRVTDDYTDITHKGVCSDACAANERGFMAFHTAHHYWVHMSHNHGVNKQDIERKVPKNPNHRGKK